MDEGDYFWKEQDAQRYGAQGSEEGEAADPDADEGEGATVLLGGADLREGEDAGNQGDDAEQGGGGIAEVAGEGDGSDGNAEGEEGQ